MLLCFLWSVCQYVWWESCLQSGLHYMTGPYCSTFFQELSMASAHIGRVKRLRNRKTERWKLDKDSERNKCSSTRLFPYPISSRPEPRLIDWIWIIDYSHRSDVTAVLSQSPWFKTAAITLICHSIRLERPTDRLLCVRCVVEASTHSVFLRCSTGRGRRRRGEKWQREERQDRAGGTGRFLCGISFTRVSPHMNTQTMCLSFSQPTKSNKSSFLLSVLKGNSF